jgi:cytochrome c553
VIRPTYLLAGLAGFFIVALIVLTGVIPIQASSGHWRITAWMLDLTKRRSVDLYSQRIVAPPLDRAAWIARGAGHYESGCRQCHGSPLAPRPLMMMRVTPHPPELPQRIARWEDRELFQIVKHGIKFTAMPAWTAPQRADEIWSIVAFLRVLPGLSAQAYSDLAIGNPGAGMNGVTPVERCARCHGADGLGRGGVFPVLAGQHAEYLDNALVAYRDGARHSGFMQPEAADLDDARRAIVVTYFSGLPPPAPQDGAQTANVVFKGDAARQVPACSECHGPRATDRNPAYPSLAGQSADYLVEQLQLFAENRRGGSSYAPIMQAIAGRLTPDERRVAAEYYAAAGRPGEPIAASSRPRE